MLFTFKDYALGASGTENPRQAYERTMVNIFEPRLNQLAAYHDCFWPMMCKLGRGNRQM
jgi:hypothetical protein